MPDLSGRVDVLIAGGGNAALCAGDESFARARVKPTSAAFDETTWARWAAPRCALTPPMWMMPPCLAGTIWRSAEREWLHGDKDGAGVDYHRRAFLDQPQSNWPADAADRSVRPMRRTAPVTMAT